MGAYQSSHERQTGLADLETADSSSLLLQDPSLSTFLKIDASHLASLWRSSCPFPILLLGVVVSYLACTWLLRKTPAPPASGW
ncbi:hypothetical protein SBA1_1610005 [Candidatus Sulfotelmatobacter kueseliae]|uniref:Uncharacterized protein n=1 Tax=Candidatus Sulfotelmatobacter kueseliae TaxID=2042962 RepID=A0A2U3KAS1_9BACT|nr:hypothetical protein SBA1_1610005 [Candidatus Sulfotelmatobacter kueseliae]